MNELAMELMIAFAGGVFGAAFGALPSFILCGLFGIIGAVAQKCGGGNVFTNYLTWGLMLGCQTSFSGGVAGAAYAAKKKYIESGRDICAGLMGLDKTDVLIVGGIFGAMGQGFMLLFDKVPKINGFAWTNTLALAVIATAIIARIVFRGSPFGKVAPGQKRFTPTETACWLPWQSRPSQIILIAIGMGFPAAYIISQFPDMLFLMFGIGAFSLIFLQFGTKIPVTHHIGLAAGYFAFQTGNFWWAAAAGMTAAFLAEFFACLFLIHGDSHIDPPTCSLVCIFSIHPLLSLTGLLNKNSEGVLIAPEWIPVAAFIAVTILGYTAFTFIRRSPAKAEKLQEKAAA